MTQVFTIDGVLIPVTVVEVKPNIVMGVKTRKHKKQSNALIVRRRNGK